MTITVENADPRAGAVGECLLDGTPVDPASVAFHDDGQTHELRVVMGRPIGARHDAGVVAGA